MNRVVEIARIVHTRGLLLVGLLVCLAAPLQTSAQVVGGTILGRVTDPSEGFVPHAQILIRNLENGTTRSVETDAAGFYAAPNLQPGTYEVKASAAGFAANAKTDITITVGAQQLLNFTLNVGQVDESVTVNSTSMIDLVTSTIGAVVDSTTIRELPLNGRSWTDLATLQPGVLAVETQSPFTAGSNRGNRGFESEVAINGAASTE
jgi:hypothetical protein